MLDFGYQRFEVGDGDVEVLSEQGFMLTGRVMSLQVGDLFKTGEALPGALVQANPPSSAAFCWWDKDEVAPLEGFPALGLVTDLRSSLVDTVPDSPELTILCTSNDLIIQ